MNWVKLWFGLGGLLALAGAFSAREAAQAAHDAGRDVWAGVWTVAVYLNWFALAANCVLMATVSGGDDEEAE